MKTLLAALALLVLAGDVVAGCPPRVRYAAPYYPSYYPASYYAQPSYTASVSYQPVYQSAVAELVTPSVTTVTQFVPVQVAAFSAGFSPAVTAAAGAAVQGTAVQGAAIQGNAVQGAAAPEAAARPAAAAQPTNADLMKAVLGINDSLKNTDQRLQRLEAKVFGEPEVVTPSPDAPRDAPRAQPSPAPPPPVMPPAADPRGPRSALDLKGIQVVTAKCAACHDAATAARKGEGFVLTQERYPLNLPAAKAAKVIAKVKAGEMPPSHPLPDDERAAVAAHYESTPGGV